MTISRGSVHCIVNTGSASNMQQQDLTSEAVFRFICVFMSRQSMMCTKTPGVCMTRTRQPLCQGSGVSTRSHQYRAASPSGPQFSLLIAFPTTQLSLSLSYIASFSWLNPFPAFYESAGDTNLAIITRQCPCVQFLHLFFKSN